VAEEIEELSDPSLPKIFNKQLIQTTSLSLSLCSASWVTLSLTRDRKCRQTDFTSCSVEIRYEKDTGEYVARRPSISSTVTWLNEEQEREQSDG
jgi:hypothetical protein